MSDLPTPTTIFRLSVFFATWLVLFLIIFQMKKNNWPLIIQDVINILFQITIRRNSSALKLVKRSASFSLRIHHISISSGYIDQRIVHAITVIVALSLLTDRGLSLSSSATQCSCSNWYFSAHPVLLPHCSDKSMGDAELLPRPH